MLILIPVISTSAFANEKAKLEIQIYGGLPLPILIKNVGAVITNTGNATAFNISFILSIIGGKSNSINFSTDGFCDYLEPFETGGESIGVFTQNVRGLGLIKITLSVSASNVDNFHVSGLGFQLGDITWVPLSWITPPILKGLIPWLDF
jgi:hypothetical protein